MKISLHELKPAANSRKAAKRKGRGIASGNGKTAGKGHKGQNARTGGGTRPGFEGGQTVIYRAIPKIGFTSNKRHVCTIVKLSQIASLPTTDITRETLLAANIIKKKTKCIKILYSGKLTSAKNIYAHKFSKQAKQEIEKFGGKAEVI